MAWDGFYPPTPCKRCGKALHGQGTGYPAELYAGTYTGLCYPCTDEPPYFTGEVELSGAKSYSHPPSCPSHRRDRETKLFFEGCDCTFGSRGSSWSYRAQCKKCSEQHYNHPAVRALTVARAKRGWKGRVFAAMAEKQLIERGVPFWSTSIRIPEFKTVDQFTPEETAIYKEVSDRAAALYKDMDGSSSFPEGYPLLTAAEYNRLVKRYSPLHDVPDEYVEELRQVAVKQTRKRKA